MGLANASGSGLTVQSASSPEVAASAKGEPSAAVYCQNCGEKASSTQAYCTKCGAPLGRICAGNGGPAPAHATSAREIELEKSRQRNERLTMLMEYQEIFAPTKASYDEISSCKRKIEQLERMNKRSAGMVWSLISACIGVLALWTYLPNVSKANLSHASSLIFVVIELAFACLFFIPIIVSVFGRLSRPRKIRDCKDLMANRFRKLYSNYNNVKPQPVVGFQYCDPYTLQALVTIMASGKVDDIAQAIRVYDMELDRKTQLYLSQETLNACLQAKNAATAAAVFSGIRLFL